MSTFPPIESAEMTGYAENPTVYCSTGKMGEPDESPHVRQIEFRLPRLKEAPIVSVQITAPHGSSMLGLYSVKVNDNVGGQTQVAVAAQTIRGGPAHGEHYCSIVVTGFPV